MTIRPPVNMVERPGVIKTPDADNREAPGNNMILVPRYDLPVLISVIPEE